jgi:hypothetical protein
MWYSVITRFQREVRPPMRRPRRGNWSFWVCRGTAGDKPRPVVVILDINKLAVGSDENDDFLVVPHQT